MARNKVQFQKGMSEVQFDVLYGTEPLCHDALVRWRWPEGFVCPDCKCREHCIVKRGARSLYQCNACRKQTSVKAGTIFESSKLPLRLWFEAMYLMTQSKKGISSIELGRRLGVTQTAAWSLKHKLAQVMIERNAAKRLKGEVQMDDAYIGGLHQGTYGRGGEDAFRGRRFRDRRRQTRSDHPSPRCRVHQDCDCQTRGHGARRRRSHRLRCARLFSRRDRGRMHPYSNQDRQRSEGGQKSAVQMGHTVLGNIEAAMVGTYRAVRAKHVPRYLTEFEYRFNRRYRLETMIDRLAYVSFRMPPMPYRLLKLADVYA